MAGVSLEDFAKVWERANREKTERKKAMDAIVDLAIERSLLRRAVRGLLDAHPRNRWGAAEDEAMSALFYGTPDASTATNLEG